MKTTKDLFDNLLPAKLKADPLCLKSSGVTNKTIAVSVEGDGGGAWAFRFDDNGAVSFVPATGESDCLIETKDQTFQGMIDGSVNVAWAFVTRKIKVKGDSALAAKLGASLQKLFKA